MIVTMRQGDVCNNDSDNDPSCESDMANVGIYTVSNKSNKNLRSGKK